MANDDTVAELEQYLSTIQSNTPPKQSNCPEPSHTEPHPSTSTLDPCPKAPLSPPLVPDTPAADSPAPSFPAPTPAGPASANDLDELLARISEINPMQIDSVRLAQLSAALTRANRAAALKTAPISTIPAADLQKIVAHALNLRPPGATTLTAESLVSLIRTAT